MPLAFSGRAANWLVNAYSLPFLSVHRVCATLHCSGLLIQKSLTMDKGINKLWRAWSRGHREPSVLYYLPASTSPVQLPQTRVRSPSVSLHEYKCLFNLSNLLSTSTQKSEKYLLWGGNSPRHEIIASKVLVIHGMALIALYLGDPNTTDFQIYPGALFFCSIGLESCNLNKWNE